MAPGGGKDAGAGGILGIIMSLLGIPLGGLLGGALSRALGGSSTPGQPVSGQAGGPVNFFSGPGATYTSPGSTLNGLGDIGNPRPADGTDSPGLGAVPNSGPLSGGGGGKGHGGGGGGGGTYVFHPYGGLQGQGAFVNWNPKYPGQAAGGATFTGGSPSSDRPALAPPPPPRGSGGVPGQGEPGGGGKAPGGGSAGRSPGKPGKTPAQDLPAPGAGLGARPAPRQSDPLNQGYKGVDTTNLDRGTPGYVQDSTTGIQDTAGMPMGTLPAPKPGESYQDYMTQLHDLGYSQDSIASIVGRYGFGPGPTGPGPGGEGWNWGTGPVMRGANGYGFANQQPGLGATGGPNAADRIGGGGSGTSIAGGGNLVDSILALMRI
jgi:hypothetical protein